LLDQPLRGRAYLRSSHNLLPDLLFSLSAEGFEVDLLGRIDSAPDGGLRATFSELPDAPVSRFVAHIYGGKRGILETAEDLCHSPAAGRARFLGHANRGWILTPPLRADCSHRNRPHHRDRRRPK
jgi:hypothetical protein